jgi:hypothetical protein
MSVLPWCDFTYDDLGCNITPTLPGYCDFYDQFGVHAYMGGRSEGKDEWLYREDWTTCCDLDTPEPHPALPLEGA